MAIKVSLDDMRTAATTVENAKEDIDTKLTELKTYIDNLVTNGFVTDKASKKFDEDYTKYSKAAKKTIKALEDVAKYLDGAADVMERTDQELANALG
jgi:WXG100 family type VII secretion target